jgi:hypothetical protein
MEPPSCLMNPYMTPRQPSACAVCNFPEHLHTGRAHTAWWTYVVCAAYVPPDQALILERMRKRRTWPNGMRWTTGRNEDR